MKVIIIGNGVSGVTAAKFLRTQNTGVEILILSEEKEAYYPRPVLIEYLAGRVKRDEIYFYPEAWYKERKIQVELDTRVFRINREEKTIQVESGREYTYDYLIIATGAKSFFPSIEGVPKPGVSGLRTIVDAQYIKEYARDRKRAVILGAGFLGLETAYAMRSAGLEAMVLEYQPRLLPRQLDEEGSEFLQKKLEERGIRFQLGKVCAQLIGPDKIEALKTQDGEIIASDLIVVAVGILPEKKLAQTAGLEVNRGVVVNKYLQTTDQNIYACGDVAEFDGRISGIIPESLAQAQAVAYNILNESKQVYRGTLSSNTLKIVDIDLSFLGAFNPVEGSLEILRKKDLEKGTYKKIILRENKVIGVVLLGDRKDVNSWTKIINRQIDVSRFKESILNEDFDLTQIAS